MLATLQQVLSIATQRGHGLGACNVFGYEDASAVIAAAEEVGSPVVLMTNTVAIQHMDLEILGPLLLNLADRAQTQVCVHLDHGTELSVIQKALDVGYSSVMFDGSQLSMEENVSLTQEVAALAHRVGSSVEAEIGAVGYSDPSIAVTARYTTVEEARQFCSQVSIDALAVAVGNVHRMEDQRAELQFDLLRGISDAVDVPIVIHGASGIPDADLPKLIACGACKINIGTALRMAFGETLREQYIRNPREYDRIKFYPACMDAVRTKTKEKLWLLQKPYVSEEEQK
jgi:fructose-bisphosphate aldolase class II